MSRMQSPETARITAKVDGDLKEDFKLACAHHGENMTDVIETKMQEFVDENGPVSVTGEQSQYAPDDPALRELYQACLDVAENRTHGPTVYQRRHASTIARESQQFAKDELGDAMMRLRRKGYAALGTMPLQLQGESADRWRNWIIKPPEADPDQWKFRE